MIEIESFVYEVGSAKSSSKAERNVLERLNIKKKTIQQFATCVRNVGPLTTYKNS